MKKSTEILLPTGVDQKKLAAMSVTINTIKKSAKEPNEQLVYDQLTRLIGGTTDEEKTLLLRNLFQIIDRESGKELGYISRIIIRWIEHYMPEWFYANLWTVPYFVKWEYLWYNQIRTTKKSSHKRPAKVEKTELSDFDYEAIAKFVADYIRSKEDKGLLAKWLPKYRKTKRWRKKVLKDGTVKRWTTNLLPSTQSVVNVNNHFINLICEEMGWTVSDYANWRKENQRTIEQQVSKGAAFDALPEATIKDHFDKMATHARFRVEKSMKNTDKWKRASQVFNAWKEDETRVAEKIRTALSKGDEEGAKLLRKASKAKTGGGLQTYDLLYKLMKENDISTANNLHSNLMVDLMDKLDGDVYTIIDWSGSMESYNQSDIAMIDIANTLAVTFSTMHKNPMYKNEFMVFGKDAVVVGTTSKYSKTGKFQVAKVEERKKEPTIDAKWTFEQNLRRMREARRGMDQWSLVSATNMGACFEHFIQLVKDGHCTPEELPVALLFITDEENNMGKHPTECMADAAQIGWYPLVIWWGLRSNRMSSIRCENFLPVTGFAENVLSEVLTFLRNGVILPGAELLAVNDNPRYKDIKY